MSNFDSMWNEQHQAAAVAEGWRLVLVVDEGKPVETAYFDIFDADTRFKDRRAAVIHVYRQAKGNSKLHITAMSACSSSRVQAATRTPPKGKKK